MKRIPEPELMDSVEQTQAYAAADFSEPNRLFSQAVHDALDHQHPAQRASLLDLGCGSGGLLVELARTLPTWNMIGVDAGPNMLKLARQCIDKEHLAGRVRLVEAHLPSDLESLRAHGPFQAIVSNSLVHHLHDPMTMWESIQAVGQVGTQVVVMDLTRPASLDEAKDLVEVHAQGALPALKEDFYNSLLAAWRPDEIASQLTAMGWGHWSIERPSNRHWLVSGRL
ncbi:MAG TPA: class I SAM-dependent methyltransferase [Wenzhouxiangella sp.]